MTSLDDRPRARAAEWLIALSGFMIAAGGVMLGLQVDGNGRLSGTGFASLAIGAMLALVASLVRVGVAGRLPRDAISVFAAVTTFLGMSFVLAGVLAPGGPWMFFQVLVLLILVALRRSDARGSTRWIGAGTAAVLGLMLIFRLWITYQGSEHRWQLLSIQIPILSWIPFDFLAPVQSVSLGSFTPHELGFPPAGLDFAVTMTLWAVGFSACAAGLALQQGAVREHENDRIHDVIHSLPPALAALVERLLPEEDWHALGLHGLSDRRLCKKIEALVNERIQRQREFQSAFESSAILALTNSGGFSGEIHRALARYGTQAEQRAFQDPIERTIES